MAVNTLLSLKGKAPDTSNWKDVSAYYRAWLAAHQTKAEYAMLLEILWSSLWPAVPKAWLPKAPNEAVRPDLSISIDTLWNEDCFSRRFEYRGYALELSVSLSPEAIIYLGILLYDEDENVLLSDGDLPSWAQWDESDTYWLDQEVVKLSECIDTSPFEPFIKAAWIAVTQVMTLSRANVV